MPAAAERTIWTARAPLDERAVVFLRDLGFRQLLVPGRRPRAHPGPTRRDPARRACEPPRAICPSPSPPPTPTSRTPSAAHTEPVRDAYLWLTELAYLALQPPDNVNGPQGVVVLPTQWAPDTSFLSTVLAGLQANPLVVPTTAAQFFDQVLPAKAKNGQAIERTPTPRTPEDLRAFGQQLDRARRSLTSYGSMLPATSALPAQPRTAPPGGAVGRPRRRPGARPTWTRSKASSTGCGARWTRYQPAPSPSPAGAPSCRSRSPAGPTSRSW